MNPKIIIIAGAAALLFLRAKAASAAALPAGQRLVNVRAASTPNDYTTPTGIAAALATLVNRTRFGMAVTQTRGTTATVEAAREAAAAAVKQGDSYYKSPDLPDWSSVVYGWSRPAAVPMVGLTAFDVTNQSDSDPGGWSYNPGESLYGWGP